MSGRPAQSPGQTNDENEVQALWERQIFATTSTNNPRVPHTWTGAVALALMEFNFEYMSI